MITVIISNSSHRLNAVRWQIERECSTSGRCEESVRGGRRRGDEVACVLCTVIGKNYNL